MSESKDVLSSIKIVECKEVHEGTVYLIPPIPTFKGENILDALIRHAENHPEQFGKIEGGGK